MAGTKTGRIHNAGAAIGSYHPTPPLQSAPSREDLDPHLIHDYLDPHESLAKCVCNIGSAVFAQLTRETNIDKDHATCSICSNRRHLCIASWRCGLVMHQKRLAADPSVIESFQGYCPFRCYWRVYAAVSTLRTDGRTDRQHTHTHTYRKNTPCCALCRI